jgi:hypothetical protein
MSDHSLIRMGTINKTEKNKFGQDVGRLKCTTVGWKTE